MCYSAKLPFRNEGEKKIFPNPTKGIYHHQTLLKILKGVLQSEMKEY